MIEKYRFCCDVCRFEIARCRLGEKTLKCPCRDCSGNLLLVATINADEEWFNRKNRTLDA